MLVGRYVQFRSNDLITKKNVYLFFWFINYTLILTIKLQIQYISQPHTKINLKPLFIKKKNYYFFLNVLSKKVTFFQKKKTNNDRYNRGRICRDIEIFFTETVIYKIIISEKRSLVENLKC